MSLMRKSVVSLPMAGGDLGKYTVNPDKEGGRFHWSEVDGEAMWGAIAAVTEIGDSILFGMTKEGQCGFVMVLSGGLGDKMYPKTPQEADELLEAIRAIAARSEPT